MTAAGDPGPQAAVVGDLKQRSFGLAARDDVLVEAQLAAWAQDAAQLRERAVLVGDRAEHEARDGGVRARVLERQLIAGIRVYPNITVVHLREDLYPEPTAFRSERFLDGRTQSYSWLPFGGGIRRCIGAALPGRDRRGRARRVLARHVERDPTHHRPGRDARDHARPQARHAGRGHGS